MKTLQLFNAVVYTNNVKGTPIFNKELGIVIMPNAFHLKDNIISYYKKEMLSGNQLNLTFHKSWAKIKNSSKLELYIKLILHYCSTYGTNFTGNIYIPDEYLEVSELKVVNGLTKKEMIEKSLHLLQSGIALKEETIDDLLSLLTDELDYSFTGMENIKNKEAIVKIADIYNVLPTDTMEFFRYIIYKATSKTLLIKNDETIQLIKDSNYNPAPSFKQFGLEKLVEIFNRFKPLFLAFKNKCPKTINKISKLSKKYHKPLTQNPLNREW